MKTADKIRFDDPFIEQAVNAYMPLLLDKNFSREEKEDFLRMSIHEVKKASVNSALQEAQEQICNKKKLYPTTDYEQGKEDGLDIAETLIRSLQIKDTKETTIDDVFKE